MTHGQLEGYEPGANIQISRGPKYKDIIAKLFPQTRRRGLELAKRRKWITYKCDTRMASKVHYDPADVAGFSTLDRFSKAVKHGKRTAIKSWLEGQAAFTLHRPARKRFQRNPYTVNNMMDAWKCDLLDMQAHCKVYDN
jgi:hypothetical protein